MAKIDLLTAAKVKSLKAPGDYLDGRGLYLQIRSESSKSWLLKYSMQKRAREMGLGSAFDFSLADARETRDRCRKLIKVGVDPIDHRKAEEDTKAVERAKSVTFKQAATRYIAANRASWKNIKHADQWASTLETYAYPIIGHLPVQSIDTTLVMKILDPIWSTKTETASRVRGRIETVIDSCKVRGEFKGENPARWKGHLDKSDLPKPSQVRQVEHHPALPYAQLPAFMIDLRACEGIAAAALEFQILTVARPGNALNAKWTEIDREKSLWTITAERMKGRKGKAQKHVVSLSAAALDVLDRMEKIKNGEYIFFGAKSGRPLTDAATSALIDRMNEQRETPWIDPVLDRVIVPHGFRSTFSDWAAERQYPDAIADAALAHKVSDKVKAAYQRTTFEALRKGMMDDWATFATIDPARAADVLVFPAASSRGDL